MIRGCQKKVYYIKNIESKYFDEAYLIMKNDADVLIKKNGINLAAEADRIIHDVYGTDKSVKQHGKAVLGKAGLFALGAASSSAVIGTIALIIGLS